MIKTSGNIIAHLRLNMELELYRGDKLFDKGKIVEIVRSGYPGTSTDRIGYISYNPDNPKEIIHLGYKKRERKPSGWFIMNPDPLTGRMTFVDKGEVLEINPLI